MKTHTILLAAILCLFGSATLAQPANDAIYYYAPAGITFHSYNLATRVKGADKVTCQPLKFIIANSSSVKLGNQLYYIVKFDHIKDEGTESIRLNGVNEEALKGNARCINSVDNNQYYIIEVDSLSLDGESPKAIERRYRTYGFHRANRMYPYTNHIAYGATLTTPFKFRPKIGDRNYIFSPEIQLGGYLGMKGRLASKGDMFLYFPVITAGVSSIQLNDNSQEDKNQEDGLAMGFTHSFGAIAQFDQFQIGVLWGHDYVSGEQGKNWIYNEMPWYSFSIGYNFLSSNKKEEKKEEKAKAQLKNDLQLQKQLNLDASQADRKGRE